MIDSETAKATPPSPSNAEVTEPAIGTLATVAMRNSTRTDLALLDTAFADHVNCVHGSQIMTNSSPNSRHAGPVGVVDQEVHEAGEREHVDQVEEQLDRVGREVLLAIRNVDAPHLATVPCGRARGRFRGRRSGSPRPHSLKDRRQVVRSMLDGRAAAVPRVGRRGRRAGHVAARDARVRRRRVRGAPRRGGRRRDRPVPVVASGDRGRSTRELRWLD